MPETSHAKRLTEITKCVPVIFVVAVIAILYVTYVFFHCVPLLQLHIPNPAEVDTHMRARGTWQLSLFLVLSSMLVICYVRSILVSPGEIPDTPEWMYYGEAPEESGAQVQISLHETKRSGERRHCKWCSKYKPDRAHHCRVCRVCILKMDHHCPWIYNCVGFQNHKFFFLLLLYTFGCSHLIVFTMGESVKRVVDEDSDFAEMFTLVFGETLASFLAVMVTAFFGFHIWLMFKAMTTIEFCEKSMKKVGYSTSPYHRGVFGDLQEVLGRNPLLWWCPVFDLTGDGLSFVNEGTRLTVDLDVGRQIKRTVPRRSRVPQDKKDDDPLLEDAPVDLALPPPS
jgi:hypothetical protein